MQKDKRLSQDLFSHSAGHKAIIQPFKTDFVEQTELVREKSSFNLNDYHCDCSLSYMGRDDFT